ncbi:MAG TPA: hypothetical protein PLB38_02685 [bacterium]|nr:hypothetical protein [bacterium]
MNHKTLFSVLFTIFISLFALSACDDGGDENNNNLTVDQDVKDWCAEWLYCSGEDWHFDNIPWETQEECEQIIQYIKKHQDDSVVLDECHSYMLVDTIEDCTDIDRPWQPRDYCSYTSFGICEDGDWIEVTCPAVE